MTFKKITYEFKARENFERIIQYFLLVCSTLAILITIGIVLSVLFESNRFFNTISITEFLFGTHWSPQRPTSQVGAGLVHRHENENMDREEPSVRGEKYDLCYRGYPRLRYGGSQKVLR